MFIYLLLLFTLLPFVELTILLWMAVEFGWPHTLLLVIVTGVVGASLARWQGLRTFGRVQQEMAAGRVPGSALVDGLLILVAGAMLLTPGIITDACGFALLIPPIRNQLKRSVRRWFERRVQFQEFTVVDGEVRHTTHAPPPRDRVIDVEVTGTRVVDDNT